MRGGGGCVGVGKHGIWWCGVGGWSENLLFLRQKHWSYIKDGPIRSSHCITILGLKEVSQMIVHLFIVEVKVKRRR